MTVKSFVGPWGGIGGPLSRLRSIHGLYDYLQDWFEVADSRGPDCLETDCFWTPRVVVSR